MIAGCGVQEDLQTRFRLKDPAVSRHKVELWVVALVNSLIFGGAASGGGGEV